MTEEVANAPKEDPIKIKKYANRRLYNTATSSYVTLDHLAQMVKEGKEFIVHDAKTNDDITRSVLTQIIFEEEGKGQNLLPTAFLRQLIGFYGGSMQGLVPRYLEEAMSVFTQQQEQIRATMQRTVGTMVPFGNMEEMGRQNLAMVERALSLFTPFQQRPEPPPAANATTPNPAAPNPEVAALRSEVERLRRELARTKGRE